jgi:TRAP-type C4-dicarboxylate transport system substrate-binding protein
VTTALTLAILPAGASAFEKLQVRVLGNFQNQLQSSKVERPFFEGLPRESGGKVTVNFRTMDEVGIKGFEGVRLLKLGVFDIMAVQLGYVSGDDPFLNGLDLPGIASDITTARKVADAYRAVFDKRVQERHNGKLLALWPYPAQMVYCRGPISGLDDFKGKKIRVWAPTAGHLVESLGGVGVTLSFPENYQALQRGVVDCSITGSLSGNTAKWPEVTTHFYPLALAWGMQTHVANLDFWNRLEPDARAFFEKQLRRMEEELWELADVTTQDGVRCNTSTGPCSYGSPFKMTLVPVKESDRARLKELVEKVVLPRWAADCNKNYTNCSGVWNETVGKAVGMTIR